ncbi:penicillin-binding protein activator [Desulfobacula sp.]|uniref:penicillin-binding protein activator n=1 Tax=Desulfobacula sp. TaxID=2593537 RepID=UPI002604FE13|nr:penicillin-binding protein activator [Desulfobacula sp.]
MGNKTFIALISIYFIVFYSCAQKKEIINIPPLPVIASDLISPEICNEQNQKLIEIEKLFSKKSFDKALDTGTAILENPCSVEHYIKALEWVGDVFNARGEKTNAFHFYSEALEYLDRKTSKSRVRALTKKIAEVTALKKIIKKTAFKKNKIGVLLPLTGYYHLAGHRVLDAIKLAVNKFNDTQSTMVFQLSVKDTASDSAAAVKAVKKFEKEKVSCIIGPMITVRSAAIESNNLGIPMMVMSQKPDVTRAGQFILRNYMTPAMQIRTGISYFLDNYGFTRFAILYPNEKYGMVFKAAFIDVISQYDAELAIMVSYEPSQTDFSDQIQKLITGYQKFDENGEYVDLEEDEVKKRNKIYRAKIDFDVLFIPDTAGMVNMIAPQLKYHGIDVQLMGTNLWNSQKLLPAKDYVQTAVFPDGFYPDSKSKRVKDFISSYFKATDNFPEYTEAIAYDTAMIIMNALSSPAVSSRKDVVKYLQSNTFSRTITCPTSFDPQGEPVKPLELFQVMGDEIKLIRSCDD